MAPRSGFRAAKHPTIRPFSTGFHVRGRTARQTTHPLWRRKTLRSAPSAGVYAAGLAPRRGIERERERERDDETRETERERERERKTDERKTDDRGTRETERERDEREKDRRETDREEG